MVTVRPEIQRLVELGSMPSDGDARDEQLIRAHTEALDGLPPPGLSDEEAVALLDVFPRDRRTVYGSAWSLRHAIESASGWPVSDALDDRSWWVTLLRERAERASIEHIAPKCRSRAV